MRKIAISNNKGGVGKTTSAVNIGAGLLKFEKKVLLIDIDPQSHLTYSLGIKAHEIKSDVYDLMTGSAGLSNVIVRRNGLDLIPSSPDMEGDKKKNIMDTPGNEFLLKNALSDLSGYDYVIIDCPPALGILTMNALTSVSEVFIPLQTEFLALQGMSELLKKVRVIKEKYNESLDITGIFATMYNERKKLNREVLENVKRYFPDKVFKTCIRENIAIAEAPSFGKSIFDYDKESNGAKDYLELCKEIVERFPHD